MDEPSSRSGPAWTSALRIGSHTLPATWLLVAACALSVLALLPALSFVFGQGLTAPILIALLLFTGFLLFRRRIFRSIYPHIPNDEDAALIEYLVQQNTSGVPGEEETEMELLENALHLKQVSAADCMAPRPEIVAVDADAPVAVLRQLFIDSRLSRILVFEGELDKVLGYVHVQQLFGNPSNIRSLIMPIGFVPESIHVDDLLHRFVKNRTNIACVVDEYGGISGLVSLEDVLEQLFGKIDDEHDLEDLIETQTAPGVYLFSGRHTVQYLNEKYPELKIPEGDYNTLSGYLMAEMQKIPEQGASLELEHMKIVIELVSERRIETVRISII
jgi:putative hemolysin